MIGNLRAAALDAGRELARRTELARQPRPDGVSGPSLRLLLAELGALVDRVRPAGIRHHVALRPQPVMLLPGFGSHPGRMRRMRQALRGAGHSVDDWGLGFNLGPTPGNFAFLMRRVDAMAQAHGQPVALVGWSLGGLFAREIACRQPAAVGKVITMGTPFSGDRRANNGWRAYQAITGHTVDEPPVRCDTAARPPVPTIALWSPRDGVIAPRSACGRPGERDRAIALRCNHLGFPGDPAVIAEVLRQLDRED
ncbi:MAG: alpha/beta hydrolase [Novosphingobium sp.]|jgi:pimeloyl-ACP methyl ester carboxylesterase|nr:alpha/beta hydrolase [Novosphingobium sp.]